MINEIKVNIKRIDQDLPLPIYQTDGSVAFDLSSREDIEILPKELARIPSNIIVQTPPGCMLLLVPRSSLPAKKPGLIIPHGIGIIDQDYCGPNDELLFQVYNVSDKLINIKRGERIAQAVFVKVAKAEFEEVKEIAVASRGSFGSTD